MDHSFKYLNIIICLLTISSLSLCFGCNSDRECIQGFDTFKTENFKQFIKDNYQTEIDSYCYETSIYQLCHENAMFNIQFYIECQNYYGSLAERRTEKLLSKENVIVVYLQEDSVIINNKKYKSTELNNLYNDLKSAEDIKTDSLLFYVFREEWGKNDFGTIDDYHKSNYTYIDDIRNLLTGFYNQEREELITNSTFIFEYKNIQYFEEKEHFDNATMKTGF